MSSFVKNSIEVFIASVQICRRFKDRNFRFRLKKNEDDEDDDEVLTKQKYQKDLDLMYTSKEFEGEKAFSRMMTIIFVILVYSSSMPVLYVVGVFFCGLTYFVKKFLLLKYYRISSTMTKTVPLTMMKYFKFSLVLHIIFSLIMLTHS